MGKKNSDFYRNIRLWKAGLLRFLVCLAMVPVVPFIIDFPDMYQMEANRYELKKGYTLVKGFVYDVNTLRKVRKMYYFYVINGVKYKDDSEYGLWEKKYGRAPEVGDSVSICYKKNNPEVHMVLEYFTHEPVFDQKLVNEIYLRIHGKKQ